MVVPSRAFSVAVGTQDTYHLSGRGARISTVAMSGASELQVSGKRLDEVIGGEIVDLLKIDCEGAELDVLHSLGRRGLERVARIVLEYHNFSGERNDMLASSLLRKAGYDLEVLPDPDDPEIGYIRALMV